MNKLVFFTGKSGLKVENKELYRLRLFEEQRKMIAHSFEFKQKLTDLKYSKNNTFGSIEHIIERCNEQAQMIESEIDAYVFAEVTIGSINDPLSQIRILDQCKSTLSRGKDAVFSVFGDKYDNTSEEMFALHAWDSIKYRYELYAKQQYTIHQREFRLLRLFTLSTGIPTIVLEDWEAAIDTLANGNSSDTITETKILIDSVLKHVLAERGEVFNVGDNSTTLFKKLGSLVQDTLSTDPSEREAAKKIVRGLQTFLDGLQSIRNLKSDAHGRRAVDTNPDEGLTRAILLGTAALTELIWHAHTKKMGSINRIDERIIKEIEAVLAKDEPLRVLTSKGRNAAEQWCALGFDSSDVYNWLQADCSNPAVAKQLRDEGFSAEEAALRLVNWDARTIGQLVQLGIMSVGEATVVRDTLMRDAEKY